MTKKYTLKNMLSQMDELESTEDTSNRTRMASKVVIAQKASEYIDLFDQNPTLEAKALVYTKPKAKSHERNKKYYERLKSEMQKLALETIEHLASGRRLSAFEEEVRQELLLAQEMGIQIPILFKGKKDPTLEALKNLEASYKHENDLERLESIIDGMSVEEFSRFQHVAQRFVKENLIPIKKGESNGSKN